MPRKAQSSDDEFENEEVESESDSESDSDFEEEENLGSDRNENVEPNPKGNVDSNNDMEIIRRCFESLDKDTFWTVFKETLCKTMMDTGCRSASSSKQPERVACPSNSLGGNSGVERKVTSRFSGKGFRRVIRSLTEEQKELIKSYGFGSLLNFSSCSIPMPFAAWICDRVNCRLRDIVVQQKSINMSPESVRDVLGLPLGRRDILSCKDKSEARSLFQRRSNPNKLPDVYEQRRKLKDPNLDEEEFMRTFLSIALSCFLCPSSGANLTVSVCFLQGPISCCIEHASLHLCQRKLPQKGSCQVVQLAEM